MRGIRPGSPRTRRKAQRPAMGAFRAATMHQYFSATNFLPVNDAESSTACPLACPTQATLVTNPENNPFIQMRPCWAGRAALRGPLPRLSPRLAGTASSAARILRRHDSRSVKLEVSPQHKIKGPLPPAQTQVPRGHISSRRHVSGTSVSRRGRCRPRMYRTINTKYDYLSLSVDSRFVRVAPWHE